MVDKTSLPTGLIESQLGHCSHAIRVPEANFGYEVGILKHGGNFLLLCDEWDSGLKKAIGSGGGLIKQAYTAELVKSLATEHRWLYTEKKLDNALRLTLTK